MRSASTLTCLWPGLARLWLRGETTGLALAVAFTAGLNLALVSTFVWTETLSLTARNVVWVVLAVAWVFSAWRNLRNLPQLASLPSAYAEQDLFQQAQTEYLKGHWVEAESILERIVRNFPQDVDARLMLATLQRHTSRLEEASRQLKALSRLPASQKWYLEISRELARLTQLAEPNEAEKPEAEGENQAEPVASDQAQLPRAA